MNHYKIQGEYSEDDQAFLYWSNRNGWVDFMSATMFYEKLTQLNMPIGATHIAFVDNHDEITHTEKILSLTPST